MDIAVELWHLILAGSGGVAVFLLALQRIASVKKNFEDKATDEAVWKHDVEGRIARLEAEDKVTTDMLDTILSEIRTVRDEFTRQHGELKEFVYKEIRRVEEKIS